MHGEDLYEEGLNRREKIYCNARIAFRHILTGQRYFELIDDHHAVGVKPLGAEYLGSIKSGSYLEHVGPLRDGHRDICRDSRVSERHAYVQIALIGIKPRRAGELGKYQILSF